MNKTPIFGLVVLIVALMGVSGACTWAAMTITDLREDVKAYEERVQELKGQQAIIGSVTAQLQEENEVLSNHPLR